MIRRAVINDIDSILSIERVSYDTPWNRDHFEFEIYNEHAVFLIYEEAGKVAGYIVGWSLSGEVDIANIAVDINFRQCGIAKKLIEDFFACIAKPFSVFLEVREDNVAAKKLYEKFGFSIYGKRKDYYGAGKNALLMRLYVEEVKYD